MSGCVVNELLNEPDNIEIIREQIGAILHKEAANQYRLAQEAGDAAKEDYNIKVYLENETPLALLTDDDTKKFSYVNVTLDGTDIQSGSTKNSDKMMKAVFWIDCYNHGNFSGDGLTGRSANIAAWKTARIIRNILCASDYTYLKLRGIVGSREVVKMQTGKPKLQNSAVNISICRITLEVTYDEQSPGVQSAMCERIDIAVDDDGLIC